MGIGQMGRAVPSRNKDKEGDRSVFSRALSELESFQGEGEAEARVPGCLCWLLAHHASVRILPDSDLLFSHVGILAVLI